MTPLFDHWDSIYRERAPESVSWYRPSLDTSLALIEGAGIGRDARVIDVGAGASTLVDALLDRGFEHLTACDVSAVALDRIRERLGPEAREKVRWLTGDVTELDFAPNSYDLWHDRAAFHFLLEPAQREAYLSRARKAVAPGGHVLLATFALDGPDRCSGLPVRRHSPAQLAEALGPGFEQVAEARELHRTPTGREQSFAYVLCQRAP